MNLLELRLNKVKIVKQPFGSRRDVLTALRNVGNIVVGLTQRGNVVLNSREKRQVFAPTRRTADGLRLGKAAAVLLKTLRAKQLRTD